MTRRFICLVAPWLLTIAFVLLFAAVVGPSGA